MKICSTIIGTRTTIEKYFELDLWSQDIVFFYSNLQFNIFWGGKSDFFPDKRHLITFEISISKAFFTRYPSDHLIIENEL